MSSSRVPMSVRLVRLVPAVAGAALIGVLALAAPAQASVGWTQGQMAAEGIGTGRFVPTVAGLVGLIGVVLGGLALARSAGRIGGGDSRRSAIAAGVAGLIAVAVGGVHLANSAGGFGTGNGRAGAIVAMVVGLVGIVLGGLATARARRAEHGSGRRPIG